MNLQAADTASKVVPWHVLDARKSIEDLHSEITSIAKKTIADVENQPIAKLWL